MQSTLHKPAFVMERAVPKATTVLFWIFTALFCLEMCFTAYYEMLPQGAQAFARLGFADGVFPFRAFAGQAGGRRRAARPHGPRGSMVKEWAYAGFAINLVSAIIAHASISDRPLAFLPVDPYQCALGGLVLSWRRLQATHTKA